MSPNMCTTAALILIFSSRFLLCFDSTAALLSSEDSVPERSSASPGLFESVFAAKFGSKSDSSTFGELARHENGLKAIKLKMLQASEMKAIQIMSSALIL